MDISYYILSKTIIYIWGGGVHLNERHYLIISSCSQKPYVLLKQTFSYIECGTNLFHKDVFEIND